MMHLCRELFPSVLEKEGLLFTLLDNNFARSKFLYADIINSKHIFQDFIYGLINVKNIDTITDKTPTQLLSEAGYKLYECNDEFDISKFIGYYSDDEALCTFRDPYRLKENYVFFAVKENAKKLKRSDYLFPEREDEYGISVISIQFSKGKTNHLSIKNRYNHHVENADSTFSNNLENIIPGLTYSFEKKYKLNIQSNKNNFELKSYIQASNGKFYKYNMEINNIYYCINNIIIDNGKVIEKYKDKSRYIFIDYYIIDMKEKCILCYDKRIDDCFLDYYSKFKKVEIEKTEDGRNLKIFLEDRIVEVSLDKQNRIVYFADNKIEEISNGFLKYNTDMVEIVLNSVKKIGDYFLCYNNNLKKANLNAVIEIGNNFIYQNNKLVYLLLPNVQKIGDRFLYKNEVLSYLNISNIMYIGSYMLNSNKYLKVLYLPKVKQIMDNFLPTNKYLVSFYAPLLEKVGSYFMTNNDAIVNLLLENLKYVGKYFFRNNHSIEKASFPNLISVDCCFMEDNEILYSFYAPRLERVGRAFLFQNKELEKLYLYSVEFIGKDFVYNNKKLKVFIAPKLKIVDDFFMYWNEEMKYLCLESLEEVGNNFMHSTSNLEVFIAPNLISAGNLVFQFAEKLKNIEVSSNIKYGDLFLDNHEKREEIIDMINKGGIWNAEGYSLCKR